MITVADLVAFLQTKDQSLPVAYEIYSEFCLMETDEIRELNLCEQRNDGWTLHYRPDKPTQKYLVFPGN